MKGKEDPILREFMEELDKAREKELPLLINNFVRDGRLVGENGSLKEPFRICLVLKLLGIRPVRSILMLTHILGKGQMVTRSDLAWFLGSEFKEGPKYMEIGRWLECLEKLEVLEVGEIKQSGRKTKGFSIKRLELHLCCDTLESILDGKGVDWTQLDILKIVSQKFDPERKIRDFVGTVRPFDPSDLIQRIIRSGVDLEDALRITAKVSGEIRDAKCTDMQTVQKIVIGELQRRSPPSSRKYVEDNPPSFVIVGEGCQDMAFNYDAVDQILDDHLSKHNIKHLSPKMRESIINSTLRKFMIRTGESREIDLDQIRQKISTTIFDLYEKTLQDMTGDLQQYMPRARVLFISAKDRMELSETYKATQSLQSSLSCCLTPFYLKLGLLPPNDAVSAISLAKDLLFPETAQSPDVEKIRTELQPVAKGLRGLLAKEKVDLADFRKSVECLLSNEIKQLGTDAEGKFREIDEEVLAQNIDSAITFMQSFLPIAERIVMRWH